MSEVILTKLIPPTINPMNIISRPRLLRSLKEQTQWKLMLVTAPAGYGKTIFMNQIVNAIKKPLVWYQLDSYDNDLAVVIKCLLTGIQRIIPKFGNKTRQLMAQSGPFPNIHLIITTLVNDFVKQTNSEMILAFDDYHLITEPTVNDFFQELLQYLPSNVHTVISSRNQFVLPLHQLKATGMLISINAKDLSFTRLETIDFLRLRQIPCTDEVLDILEQKTAGWPIVLRLLPDVVTDKLLSGENTEAYKYLAAEVLNQQPEKIRQFLLATSVLENFTAKTADLLLNRTDSAAILAHLVNAQIFLSPLENAGKAYHYHQLFRDFLLEILGVEKTVLLKRAGLLAWERNEVESAIEYYKAAGCMEEQIRLIKKAGLQLLHDGQWQTVLRWLDSIPPADIEKEPWLSFYQATVKVYQGKIAEAEPWVEFAIANFLIDQDQAGIVESQILKARIFNSHGQYLAALDQLEQVYAVLPSEEIVKCFYLPLERAFCLAKLGDLYQAETILSEALELAKKEKNDCVMTYLIEGLASILYLQGEYTRSLQLLRWADKISPDRVMPGYYIQDNVVGIYYDWGENNLALEHGKRSVATKERFGLTETLPAAYMFLGCAHFSRGESTSAETFFQRALAILELNGGDRYLYILIRAFLAWSKFVLGHWIEAKALMEENLANAYSTGGLIIPCTLMIQGIISASMGNSPEAISSLTEAVVGLERSGCRVPLCHTYKVLAWSLFNQEENEPARAYARKYLQLAAKVNLVDGFLHYTYEFLLPTFQFGLENGIEVMHIQRVLVRGGELFINLLTDLANHSNPQVRQRIIAPLAEIGGDKARGILEKMFADHDLKVGKLALTAAAKFGFLTKAQPISRLVSKPVPIEIKTFGTLQVTNGALEICNNWPTLKTRDLLAYLVHHQEPATINRIVDALWPEAEREKTASNFHITMHRLRQTLQRLTNKNLVTYRTKHYQLLPGEYVTDHRRFEDLATTALAGLNGKNNYSAAESIGFLEAAVSLYQGDYLSDLDYPWIISYQEHLKQLFYQANLELSKFYLQNNENHPALLHLQKIVELNPLVEEVHCLLMKAYARGGDWLAVKRQYQTLENVLRDELGLAPALETNELFHKLCGQTILINE